MEQVSVLPRTAPGRSAWHALRPVLVLGGFVALWWILMTGAAHAAAGDEKPRTLGDTLRSVTQAQKAEHRAPVRDVVRRVHQDAKTTVQKTRTHLRQQTTSTVRPVTRTVTAVVAKTPLAPVVKATTKTVRSTVSETVTATQALLHKTPLAPAVDPVIETVQDATQNPESSTGQGNSAHQSRPDQVAATAFAQAFSAPSATTGQQSAAPAGRTGSSTSTDADQPVDGPLGAPVTQDPCASPSGSGTTSFTPVGITESSLLVLPSVVRDLHQWRHARLPGGPAYQPGCSPD